jgi:metal-responsive CopG/Arc/MetJ family transcriptional regulator
MRAPLRGRQVTVQLTETDVAELDRIAESETISRSAAVRRLVRVAARERKAEPEPRWDQAPL